MLSIIFIFFWWLWTGIFATILLSLLIGYPPPCKWVYILFIGAGPFTIIPIVFIVIILIVLKLIGDK